MDNYHYIFFDRSYYGYYRIYARRAMLFLQHVQYHSNICASSWIWRRNRIQLAAMLSMDIALRICRRDIQVVFYINGAEMAAKPNTLSSLFYSTLSFYGRRRTGKDFGKKFKEKALPLHLLYYLFIDVEQTLYRLTSSEKVAEEIIILLNAVNQFDRHFVKSNYAAW